jgi:DNA-directed RNA polymerase subunit RPC12/RpoP
MENEVGKINKICMYCGQTIKFEATRGWVHLEGGSYMMYCPDCGWKGAPYPSPLKCPECGSKNLRDDHIARPVAQDEKNRARYIATKFKNEL